MADVTFETSKLPSNASIVAVIRWMDINLLLHVRLVRFNAEYWEAYSSLLRLQAMLLCENLRKVFNGLGPVQPGLESNYIGWKRNVGLPENSRPVPPSDSPYPQGSVLAWQETQLRIPRQTAI